MKFRHLLSVVSSFFLSMSAKAQETGPAKKETQPQIKTNPDAKGKPVNSKQNVAEKHLPGNKQSNATILPEKHLKGSSIPDKHSKGMVVPDKNYKESGSFKTQGESRSTTAVMPGSELFSADFRNEVLGEMPVGWKSNGLASIAHINGREGKWLKIDESTTYETSYNAILPVNYKVEFDFIANYKEDQVTPELLLKVFTKGERYTEPAIALTISPNGGSAQNGTKISVASYHAGGGEKFRSPSKHIKLFELKNGKNDPVHVAMSVVGNQVKVWLDGEKVYDLQEVTPGGVPFNRIGFETTSYGGPKENYSYYISNVRVVAQ